MIIEMLKNIWPINKLYNLSDRVYQLKSQYLELCEANEKLQKENESLNKKLQVLEEKNNKLEEKNNEFSLEFASYKKEASDYDWFSKFGYDRMISDLQMSCVENILPGNRERLAALKDTNKGESCFIIGNGPSLKAEDLELLKNNNIFCFASKRINLIYDKTSWRPDIWAASDLDYVETYLDEIKEMKGYTKLLCAQVITRQMGIVDDAVYYPFVQMERRPPWFNADIMLGVHFWGTITCKLINFAVYMGFKNIYLLGVDNNWPVRKNEDGKYMYDVNVKSHFDDSYFAGGYSEKLEKNINDMIKSIEYMDASYKSVKWNCEQLGVKIFNSTRGGKLEEFPRIKIEDAINKIQC